jgi:ethanolamine utilization protein EutA
MRCLLSVGIDVGTTTTQVAFCRLGLKSAAGSGFSSPPVIVSRETVYRGAARFTPLTGSSFIDMDAVAAIVRDEYRAAGFTGGDIDTGAVIITGESARTRNAADVVNALSGLAGGFVVTAAGPDLESELAARGAGADALSARFGDVFNLDIGGGTANYARYRDGKLRATGCFEIGGRRIRVRAERGGGEILRVSPELEPLLARRGVRLESGRVADVSALRAACDAMAEILEMALGLRPKSELYPRFLTVPGADIEPPAPGSLVCFTGGVSDFIYGGADEGDPFRYGDVGPLLGESLRRGALPRAFRLTRPRETIRATVVGAGAHTTQLSGGTVLYAREALPLRDFHVADFDPGRREPYPPRTAFRVAPESPPAFRDIQALAPLLLEAWRRSAAADSVGRASLRSPFVAVCRDDVAKALGHAVLAAAGGEVLPLVCIDGVETRHGDFIDIGAPPAQDGVKAADGIPPSAWGALPVIVKTLIFG